MADPKITLERLIDEHGGELIRQRKHKVYRFPSGLTFTAPSTPECPLAYDNALSDLKNLLGVHPPNRGTPGERRKKRTKRKSVQGSKMLPLDFRGLNLASTKTWKEQLKTLAEQLPAKSPPKLKLPLRPRPLTFEERMLRAGVRKLERK